MKVTVASNTVEQAATVLNVQHELLDVREKMWLQVKRKIRARDF